MSRLLQNRVVQILLGVIVVGFVLYLLGFKMTQGELRGFISAAPEPLFCLTGQPAGTPCTVPFTNSVLMTLITDAILIIIALRMASMKLIPRGFQNIVEMAVEGFYNFAQGIDRKNIKKFFPVPATIFFFFLIANLIALIPGVGSIGLCETAEGGHAKVASIAAIVQPAPVAQAGTGESSIFSGLPGFCGTGHRLIPFLRAPAADLNVTFAFALVAVFMVELFGVQALGGNYFTRFFNFKEGALGVFVGLIELVSEISRIVSFAFRIFGNIFGGEVILAVMAFLFPYILPLPFYGFEVFVAMIQAFIFAVLTLVFMSNATVDPHGGHPEHGSPEIEPELQGAH
jgi:F-type H+-transporting ATPase subunit a